jgi:hypothetical protein
MAASSRSTFLDGEEKPLKTEGGSAKGQVLVGGETYEVNFKPAGDNTMTATGDFTAVKGMKVIVKTTNVGGESFQARPLPIALIRRGWLAEPSPMA